MTFHQLLYITEIAKCGSINKAAKNLFLSQTAVSSSVKQLEKELNITLFSTSSKGVEFTPEGKEFVSYAVSLLSQKQRIESLYRTASAPASLVHFAVSTQRFFFAQDAFMRVFDTMDKSFETQYHFTFRETNMNAVINDVAEHRSNVGVISVSDYNQKFIQSILSGKNLEFHSLATAIPSIFCRSDHPLTHLETITENDLFNYPYIYYEQDLGAAAEFSEEYPLFTLHKPNKSICVTNRITADTLMTKTDAYTIGSGLLRENPPISVVSRPLLTEHRIQIGLIVTKSDPLPKETALFIKQIKDILMRTIKYTEKKRKKADDYSG